MSSSLPGTLTSYGSQPISTCQELTDGPLTMQAVVQPMTLAGADKRYDVEKTKFVCHSALVRPHHAHLSVRPRAFQIKAERCGALVDGGIGGVDPSKLNP